MKFQLADKNIFLDGVKIAFIRPDGKPQMLPGNTTHRAAVLTWLAEQKEPGTDSEENPAPPQETPAVKQTLTVESKSIPPCPPQDTFTGDKTPEVVAWYREHKPAEYKTRYAGRTHPFSKK